MADPNTGPGRRSPPPGDRPFVLVNMAMTADGKIATANRRIDSFGSPVDHAHLLDLRATADAVLCGATTVGDGGVTLDPGPGRYRRLRLRRGLAEANLRVVVSGRARLRPDAALFRKPGGPIVVFVAEAAPARRVRALARVADAVKVFGRDEVDLAAALRWLRRERGVRRLVCEGGGDLNDAMFRAGLVDEVHLTLCPKVFGGRAAPTLAEGAGVASLGDAASFTLKSVRRIGLELFLVYERAGGRS